MGLHRCYFEREMGLRAWLSESDCARNTQDAGPDGCSPHALNTMRRGTGYGEESLRGLAFREHFVDPYHSDLFRETDGFKHRQRDPGNVEFIPGQAVTG